MFEHDQNILPSPDITFDVDIICSAFGSGFDFILVQVQCLFSGWTWSGFYLLSVRYGFCHVNHFVHFESGTDFIMLVRLRILSRIESGSRVYQGSSGCGSGSGLYPILSPGPGPDFIHQVRVQVQILSNFESGSGFYQACPDPGPGPDSTNTRLFFLQTILRTKAS